MRSPWLGTKRPEVKPLGAYSLAERRFFSIPTQVGSDIAFVSIPCITRDTIPPWRPWIPLLSVDDEPLIEIGETHSRIIPRVPNKVISSDETAGSTPSRVVIRANIFWPAAIFIGLSGGISTVYSLDTGMCAHEVPHLGNYIPPLPPDTVITFMSTWPMWRHLTAMIWPVSIKETGLRPHPDVSSVLETDQIITVKNDEVIYVSVLDLPVKPITTANDSVMNSKALQKVYPSDGEPLRGPHKPFDPAYPCGQTGGQLYMRSDGGVDVVKEQFWPFDERSRIDYSMLERPTEITHDNSGPSLT